MRYLPDSHNLRPFWSRLLAPGGWEPTFWALLLLCFAVVTWHLVVDLFNVSRRSQASLIVVSTHISSLTVTEATSGRHPTPRSVLVRPTHGEVFFRLTHPHDALLTSISPDDEVSFGYYRSDCELYGTGVTGAYRLVCTPYLVQLGSNLLLDPAAMQKASHRSVVWNSIGLLVVVGLGAGAMLAKRRR